MEATLTNFFRLAQAHQKEHACGGVPYEHTNLLSTLLLATKAKTVLEIGTGIGYSAASMAVADPQLRIHTIDKDHSHLLLAQKNWKNLHISHQISAFEGKAHSIIGNFINHYDVIFFDGYTPQKKFFPEFERLLKKGGLLLTANLFLNNVTGGRYLQELTNKKKWQTAVVSDTAISVKLF